ncbi:MAG: tRNA (N(6)-L-threonylcarbamoyladenosine(37)-C(2))-methylthiotransferase MtaB [Clostridia bacterium]
MIESIGKTAENKLKVSVVTLGCKVNQYDSDTMQAVLSSGGFLVLEGFEYADFYIVNTCAVTAEAERKSRQSVGKILKINPNAKIYVCGCASQNNFSQFAKEHVEYISGTDGKIALAKQIVENNCKSTQLDCGNAFEKIVAPDFSISKTYEDNDGVLNLKTRHFIKIQDGCNNFCSYCIVPYLRGRSRSRSLSSIMSELDSVAKTAKEVVVTGINLSAYGADINISLTKLLLALQSYDMRFRLGSLEVNVINKEFLDATGGLKHFCPHFHLSLQSGDDEVLSKMNRHYTTAEYLEAVKLIREYYPNAGITTDIIVGYPEETEQQFQNSVDFANCVKFSDIHVFPYSSRKGTVAGKLPVLPPEVVASRQKRMTAVKNSLKEEYLLKQLNFEQEVLFETREDGMWCGHTPNYIKVYSTYGKNNALDTVKPTALYKDGVRF